MVINGLIRTKTFFIKILCQDADQNVADETWCGGCMADARQSNQRRLRRLDQMRKIRSVDGASRALRELWESDKRPEAIVLRSTLLARRKGSDTPPGLSRLILPKGIAQRFYLTAFFEAQCRLAAGEQWTNVLPLSGRGSWSDLFALDGAYDAKSATYMHSTVNGRTAEDLRLRQVQGALRTLEGPGDQYHQSLVGIPRGKREQRLYQSFQLMNEDGHGGKQSPNIYVVPKKNWRAAATTEIPVNFFLNGWVQVLNSSEVATWLALRMLSKWARDKHLATGIYAHGELRSKTFGLRRDTWEDGCQRLREFGLIRFPSHVTKAEATRPLSADYKFLWAEMGDVLPGTLRAVSLSGNGSRAGA
ncbi:hypothetical protein [Streptomyces sp. VB1]|uniref:hypothetical protein n=1 Tax=Streptomyces sp. VB1 TaxID=2986803 RepID=UPI002241AB9D|nr:hypothetical protein [Streptomyces sp. VB1]UZI33477.1 hypothetical protein OH133_38360 [Streptomyces sp. VB1]